MVVDRHPGMAAERMVAKRRNHGEPGEQPLGDSPVKTVGLAHATAIQAHAKRGLFDFKHHIAIGLDVVERLDALVHRVRVHFIAVHIRHVRGVNAPLHGLQVTGILKALGDEHMAVWQGAPLQFGRLGHFVGRPHVGPDDAAALHAGVAFDVHVRTGFGVGGDVHTLAIAVELDAVVGAADAVFFVAAKVKRHTSVRTKLADHAGLAVGVAKRQQLFAQQLDAHLRTVGQLNFAAAQSGHPIAPHQVAHARAGTHTDQGFRHVLVHKKRLLGLNKSLSQSCSTAQLSVK